jgi:MFS family permease
VVNQLGGTISDVGFIAAITALCEIPFILLWMLVSEKIGRNRSMLVGASIYAAYFVFLWFAPSTTYVFAITPLAALGGACLLSLAIAFLQDVIPERPALSTALMSISDFNSWVVAASLFYVSSLFSDKVPMTLLGALLSVCGGLAIAATKERSHRRTASA